MILVKKKKARSKEVNSYSAPLFPKKVHDSMSVR